MCSEIRTHFRTHFNFQLPKYGIFGRKKRKQMPTISMEFRFSAKSIMLRIHLPPPKIPNIRQDGRNFLILGEGGFERRLLATCRWHVATAVAFSAEKANPPSCCKFRADFRGEYRLSRSLRVLHSATLTPTLTPTAMGRNVPGWTK